MAEGCKRLIKNAITCWNYLYLSQKISETMGPEAREIEPPLILRTRKLKVKKEKP